jgi:glycosyltransferase involved in cell wall biosynthesis
VLDISVVTSLFRSENFLQSYVNRVLEAGRLLHVAGLSFQVVVVSNNASPTERRLITSFEDRAQTFQVKTIYVDRESVYASWNRGVEASDGTVIGFWNVDDVRHVDALVEARNTLTSPHQQLIYFPYTVVRLIPLWKLHFPWRFFRPAIPFNRSLFRTRTKVGPFFIFTPDLYRQVGPFDSRFKIVGDLEWSVRAMNFTDFTAGKFNAGDLVIHGSNLSGVYHPLENVERNMIYLMHDMLDELVPADPELMRQVWTTWNLADVSLSPAVQEQLWGRGAQENWEHWKMEQLQELRRLRILEAVRFLPRQLIDRTGLRSPLTRLGLLKRPQSHL